MKHLELCNKGDYLKYQNADNDQIYVVTKDWKYNADMKFNALWVEKFNTGASIKFTDISQWEELEKLSDEVKKSYGAKMENIVQEAVKRDAATIKQVFESLEAIFPGNWELVKGRTLSSLYTMIIRFPDINIVNGKGMSHNIKDLYVKWGFTENFVMNKGLEGTRSTLSYLEYNSGYFHSHLPSCKLNEDTINERGVKFNAFCLGSGDFATLNTDWKIPREGFSQEDFELLLYQLDAYVRWESLQGGPYIRMENLGARGNDIHLSKSNIRSYFNRICNSMEQFPLKFNPLNKKFHINQEALEDFIAEDPLFSTLAIAKVNKTAGGDYIYGNTDPVMLRRWIKEGNQLFSNTPVLHFKGEDICLRITELNSVGENSTMKKVPHPAVTEYAKAQLIKITNNYFIKTYGI